MGSTGTRGHMSPGRRTGRLRPPPPPTTSVPVQVISTRTGTLELLATSGSCCWGQLSCPGGCARCRRRLKLSHARSPPRGGPTRPVSERGRVRPLGDQIGGMGEADITAGSEAGAGSIDPITAFEQERHHVDPHEDPRRSDRNHQGEDPRLILSPPGASRTNPVSRSSSCWRSPGTASSPDPPATPGSGEQAAGGKVAARLPGTSSGRGGGPGHPLGLRRRPRR